MRPVLAALAVVACACGGDSPPDQFDGDGDFREYICDEFEAGRTRAQVDDSITAMLRRAGHSAPGGGADQVIEAAIDAGCWPDR